MVIFVIEYRSIYLHRFMQFEDVPIHFPIHKKWKRGKEMCFRGFSTDLPIDFSIEKRKKHESQIWRTFEEKVLTKPIRKLVKITVLISMRLL